VARRFSEGYARSPEITECFLSDGIPNLGLALDCGSNAVKEAELLKSKGCDAIGADDRKARDEEDSDCRMINAQIYDQVPTLPDSKVLRTHAPDVGTDNHTSCKISSFPWCFAKVFHKLGLGCSSRLKEQSCHCNL
jgi:hypothetical protein